MEVKNIVYGLRDPRNDVYYYIGKSTVGVTRPLKHLTESHSEKVREWVGELAGRGLSPLIDIIEEVETIDELPAAEKYWIGYYLNLNPSLLNIMLLPKEVNTVRSEKTDNDLDKLISVIDIIPEILKRERLLRNITQEDFSKLTGMSRSTISIIERGSNASIESIKLYVKTVTTKERVVTFEKERASKPKKRS